MVTLASAIDAAQRDRTEQTRQITSLNTTLAVLSEQMADDRRLREQLAQHRNNVIIVDHTATNWASEDDITNTAADLNQQV